MLIKNAHSVLCQQRNSSSLKIKRANRSSRHTQANLLSNHLLHQFLVSFHINQIVCVCALQCCAMTLCAIHTYSLDPCDKFVMQHSVVCFVQFLMRYTLRDILFQLFSVCHVMHTHERIHVYYSFLHFFVCLFIWIENILVDTATAQSVLFVHSELQYGKSFESLSTLFGLIIAKICPLVKTHGFSNQMHLENDYVKHSPELLHRGKQRSKHVRLNWILFVSWMCRLPCDLCM